eukprot:3873903-Pyramimonas_sp.AAC.1
MLAARRRSGGGALPEEEGRGAAGGAADGLSWRRLAGGQAAGPCRPPSGSVRSGRARRTGDCGSSLALPG